MIKITRYIIFPNIVELISLKNICVFLFQVSKEGKNASNRLMKNHLFDRNSATLTSFLNVNFNFGKYNRNFGIISNFQIYIITFFQSTVKIINLPQ